jgi:hypothetical protein
MAINNIDIEPFGNIIGKDFYGITAYSCHTKDNNEIRNEKSYIFKNIFSGIKWECVEFIRRWMIIRYSITFQELDNAYSIFDLPYIRFTNLITGENIPYIKYNNGSIGNLLPNKGSIIIWDKFGEHPYGHCAVVSQLDNSFIYISEQNWHNKKWQNFYSRKIQYKIGMGNSITLIDNNEFNVPILGWISLENLERNIFYGQFDTKYIV